MLFRSHGFLALCACFAGCTGMTGNMTGVNGQAGAGAAAPAGAAGRAGASAAAGASGSHPDMPSDAHVPLDAQPDSQISHDAETMKDAGRPEDAAQSDAETRDAAVADGGMPLQTLKCAPDAHYGSPLPSQRASQLVKGGFGFLEGPVWVAKLGVLLFSDMDFATSQNPNGPNSQIRRFTPPSTFDVLVASSGSNGMALDNDGRLLAATHDIQSLSHFDTRTGARESWSLRYQGKHFNSPNDLAIRSDGNVYFSDPDWQLGPRTSETGMLGVYRVAPDGTVSLVTGAIDEPNGIAISPDERTLYVGSSSDEVLSFALDAAGAVGNMGSGQTFATSGPSDGMTIDCAGNLYVALAVKRSSAPVGAVAVFSNSGQKPGEITVAEQASNLAFGGPAQTTLFITAETGLYSIELNVPGRAY